MKFTLPRYFTILNIITLSLSIVCVDTFLSFNQHVFCGSSYISIKEKAVIFKTVCGYR